MKNLKTIIIVLVLTFSIASFAQQNVFLNRDFWKSNPSIETVEAKIKEGNNIAEANSNNFDAVASAILQDVSLETLKYIQSKEGNDVNKLTHDGRTYIFWAAYKGNVAFMEYLLSKGAKTDITDDKGNTILNFAAGSGQQNTKVYDLCIANGANIKTDVTPKGANALLLAAPYDKDFTLINYFTSKGLDVKSVDANGNGIFNYVAKTGNVDLLNKLLEKGVQGTDNAFVFAAQGTRGKTNTLEFYKYLENVGLNPKNAVIKGETPLHIVASRSKDIALINYLIEKGLDVNTEDYNANTPFLNAASRNNIEIVKLLSKHLKNINQVNKKGESALALAVANNSPEVVKFLLENNADITVLDANKNNLTAYLIESFSGKKADAFKQKVDLLKENGLDITQTQENGNTLYHLAVAKNDKNILKFLSQFNINVNAKNNEGNTALHLAALQAKNAEILKYLISIGANLEATTDFDETAYDLANENEILKAHKINLDFLK
ncbi:ankyrin repeat domain-containing protein [Lacinutrix sp. C3R15]|uniref:ankyrin repeat domain-containing protein n=1 Tax=Flavobacteriaceae TaxID=49546 RepID=UPI001C08774A|nr:MULTISPECIES: ankyrin repeat domain-containing protein [Flavobacteriaceae]MBU2940962.1 ankyrin repeat domain-containing protein [Lacinutrix sp. C3R15]MDO6624281.1 ankyrin repeat domain-containing protein [Oceanihabitans sp. 1_MG-2023]